MLNIESNYNLPENTEIVFEAIPGTSQELALDSRADHTLLVGTRGSGKTAIQLMRFRKYVGLGYGKYLTGIIFDREFKNLGDLEAQSRIFFPQFEDGCRFLSSVSDYMWIWPTGERLLFRHVKKLSDYEGFHGWNTPYLGWNELTKWYDSELYDKFMSINRNSFVPEKHTPTKMVNGKRVYDTPDGKPLPPLPNQVFSTTNTIGVGRSWVKKRFVDPAPYGKPIKTSYKVFSAQEKKEIEVVKSQVCIFSSYTENPYLSIDYIASLQELTKNNENLRKSWLEGSWDVTSGGALDDLWDTNIHVIDRFPVPANWRVDRSLDWGSSKPYAVIWWAEADGTEVVLPEGVLVHGQKTFCPEKGSLIAIAELYGTKEIGTNKGLVRSASDVADDIVGMERSLLQSGWIKQKPIAGPADNSIGKVEDKKLDTVEKLFSDKGVRWIKFNKPSGSREIGLQMFRDRLECALKGEGKAIYFMRTVKGCIETIPTLPRDEKNQDDVDSDAEDHCFVGETLIKTSRGSFKIKDLVGKTGLVFTENGKLTKYHTVRKTRQNAEVIKLLLSDGTSVICTPDHKFLTTLGWRKASCLFDTKSYIITDRIDISIFRRFLWKSMSFLKRFRSLTADVFTSAGFIFNTKV